MDYNADPTIVDKEGRSPAMLSLEKSREIIQLVFNEEIIQNFRIDGMTPLYFVAQKGKKDVIKQLIEIGASPETSNDNGKIPLDAALETNDLVHAQCANIASAGRFPRAD